MVGKTLEVNNGVVVEMPGVPSVKSPFLKGLSRLWAGPG